MGGALLLGWIIPKMQKKTVILFAGNNGALNTTRTGMLADMQGGTCPRVFKCPAG